jgi:hypothetical protein
MMAILHAVDLWCPYLLGQHFQIKTDHQSLKYFLEQCISSPEQQKWVTKLFGYDYEIIYKKVKKMWWLMLFPGNMKKKGPSFPSHSLSRLASGCSPGMVARPQNIQPHPKTATGSPSFSRVLLAQ